MIALVDAPFDPSEGLARFARGRGDVGAVVGFVGLARADGGEGLELDAYAGFTESEIERVAEAAKARFDLADVAVTHRVGRIRPGEAIVQVLTAAAHRRAAFEACDYLMDYLKSAAPLWKKEWGLEGPRWVEPTAADRLALARWETPT
ncbi:MAG: molybdenum cofactor biosynthesis protein MoaE [Caulobacteraceae bacterium]